MLLRKNGEMLEVCSDTGSTYSIRQAGPEDWRVLRVLLPEAVYFGSGVEALLAIDRGSGMIAGAVAIDPVLRSEPQPGVRIAIHVVHAFRDRSVELQLLGAVEEIVRRRGARALYTWGATDAEGEVVKFWQKLGFDRTVDVLEGRTDVAAGLRYLEPLWKQLVARGKVPKNIESVSIDQTDPVELARLYVAQIGGSFEAVYPRLTGEVPMRFDPQNSSVILLDKELVGMGLARPVGSGVALVEAIIIKPGFRGGWANLFLKRESWRRCAAAGTHTVFYYTHERHRDTRRFTDKAGTVVRRLVEPYRMLSAAGSN